jgi:putative peptidoglycan lipid II flippase
MVDTGQHASPTSSAVTEPKPGRATTVAIAIGLSRLSGLLRTALVAGTLGVSAVGDAFAAALRLPNIIQNLLGEGALSASFIPEYSRLAEEDEAEAGRLAGGVASVLIVLAGSLALIGIVGARPLTRAVAWGFRGERFELTVHLVRILSVSAGVLVLSAWCLGVLNSHRRFFLSYVAPVLWNSTQIAVLTVVLLLGWSQLDIVDALAWSVIAGGILQVAIQLPGIRRANPHISLNLRWKNAHLRQVLRRLGPAVLGRGALQVSAFLDLALASLLAVGATTAIAAAQPLYILPISVIGLSVAAVELPELSRSNDQLANARRTNERLVQVLFLITGVVATYLTVGDLIVDNVFNLFGLRQRWDQDDVLLVGFTLAVFSLGLPAITTSRLIQNVLYSVGDTKTPATIALVRVSVSFLIGAILMFQLDRLLLLEGSIQGLSNILAPLQPLPEAIRENEDLPLRLGAVGLAVGASIGAWVELALLRRVAIADHGFQSLTDKGGRRHGAALVAAIAIGIGARLLLPALPRLLCLTLIGSITVATYVGVARATRCPGAMQLWSRLRPRSGDSATPDGQLT